MGILKENSKINKSGKLEVIATLNDLEGITLTKEQLKVLSLLSVEDGKLIINSDFYSTGEFLSDKPTPEPEPELPTNFIHLKGNRIIPFEAEDNPIENFYSYSTGSVKVNGQDHWVDTVLKLYMRSGYEHITTIEQNFLSGCDALREIDLSSFTNLETIESRFLYYTPRLKSIVFGAEIPPTIQSDFLGLSDDVDDIYVPNGSLDLYLNNPSWSVWSDYLKEKEVE